MTFPAKFVRLQFFHFFSSSWLLLECLGTRDVGRDAWKRQLSENSTIWHASVPTELHWVAILILIFFSFMRKFCSGSVNDFKKPIILVLPSAEFNYLLLFVHFALIFWSCYEFFNHPVYYTISRNYYTVHIAIYPTDISRYLWHIIAPNLISYKILIKNYTHSIFLW